MNREYNVEALNEFIKKGVKYLGVVKEQNANKVVKYFIKPLYAIEEEYYYISEKGIGYIIDIESEQAVEMAEGVALLDDVKFEIIE